MKVIGNFIDRALRSQWYFKDDPWISHGFSKDAPWCTLWIHGLSVDDPVFFEIVFLRYGNVYFNIVIHGLGSGKFGCVINF